MTVPPPTDATPTPPPPPERQPLTPQLPPRERRRNQLIAVVALVTVWVLLWGTLSWANVLGGLAVAAIVLTVFPLPPVTFAGRIRPLGVLRFLVRFLSDIVAASIQIAALAFRFGHPPRSAIIGVPLKVNSDLNLTLVGEAVSLVPGSLILDVDRAAGILYIHVLGVNNHEEVERFRQSVYAEEERIITAIGSAAERQRLTLPPPAGPTGTGHSER